MEVAHADLAEVARMVLVEEDAVMGSNIVLSKYARDAQVAQAEFVKSSVRTEDCPADGLPEFALVGRSNVGKSSLMNSLCNTLTVSLIPRRPWPSIHFSSRRQPAPVPSPPASPPLWLSATSPFTVAWALSLCCCCAAFSTQLLFCRWSAALPLVCCSAAAAGLLLCGWSAAVEVEHRLAPYRDDLPSLFSSWQRQSTVRMRAATIYYFDSNGGSDLLFSQWLWRSRGKAQGFGAIIVLGEIETQIEIPIDRLFVPPETDVPSLTTPLSTRILKVSNIVLSKYARDAQVAQAEFVKSSVRTVRPKGCRSLRLWAGRMLVESDWSEQLSAKAELYRISKEPWTSWTPPEDKPYENCRKDTIGKAQGFGAIIVLGGCHFSHKILSAIKERAL
ncbi:hypothetical protein RJ640_015014 [Escallonia rubra]|uniref:G domain-containing protein n=1 Tax=Escallonia rubra TaxID=112253 RepID=A0AA88UFH5_9ASTE|nr:hypothetical protein RJ640_015014 [Escallonia rubra]